jgi:hypothetical protein
MSFKGEPSTHRALKDKVIKKNLNTSHIRGAKKRALF